MPEQPTATLDDGSKVPLEEQAQPHPNLNLKRALIKAQALMRAVKKNQKNEHFGTDYADLAAMMEAIREPFEKTGLSISWDAWRTQGGLCVQAVLFHESGEERYGRPLEIPIGQGTAHGVGSAATYGKRFTLGLITGAVAEEDPHDDDGNKASDRGPADKKPPAARKAEANTQARTKAEAKAPNPNATLGFNFSGLKGKKLAELTDEQLEAAIVYAKEQISADPKAEWVAATERHLAEITAVLKARPVTKPGAPAPSPSAKPPEEKKTPPVQTSAQGPEVLVFGDWKGKKVAELTIDDLLAAGQIADEQLAKEGPNSKESWVPKVKANMAEITAELDRREKAQK